MPKYIIDARFGEIIKSARIQRNISAKSLASQIDKSPSYVTKLERGEIKSLDPDVFRTILIYIFGEDVEQTEIVDYIYDSLKIKYKDEEIEKILWFYNFSTTICHIPIPTELIDYINQKIETHNIDPDILLKRINSNEALSDEQLSDTTIEDNRWYTDKDDNKTRWIRINMQKSVFSSLLNKRLKKTSYIYILSIVYYLEKMITFHDQIELSPSEQNTLMQDATEILNQFKFYNAIEKDRAYHIQETNNTFSQLYNTYDTENIRLINDFLAFLRLASDFDVEITNKYLQEFINTTKWDPGFALKILSFEYSKLETISYHKKKAFFKDLNALIDRYYNDSGDDQIEMY